MAELTASGTSARDRWFRRLEAGETLRLGRDCGECSVTWDPWLSAGHAEVRWDGSRLHVRRLPGAKNAVFVHGEERDTFSIAPGEFFVIGKTVFRLSQEEETAAAESKEVIRAQTITVEQVRQIPFRDAPHRLDVLSRLPEVITSAANEADLLVRLANMLLAGMPKAAAVSVVALPPAGDPGGRVRVLHQEQRRSVLSMFRPSQKLVREALEEVRQTRLHIWGRHARPADHAFTLGGDFDWAFCTPVRGEACQGWGIYVTGRDPGGEARTVLGPWEDNGLGDDVKFTELVAAILGSLRQVRNLQHKQSILGNFFSPSVLRVLTEGDPESELKPREVEATVLFCDLRGFSRRVEKSAADLFAVLERVSQALGVMTSTILERDGVIADFQGDSAMAFWGWPIADRNKAQQATLAALSIFNTFHQYSARPDHPLSGFQAGIGIATGDAVAGSIGPTEHSKVSVFGPVVNLSSRLQDMTKVFRVPILVDERTAQALTETTPWELVRCRRLALVKPYGLTTPVMVHEVLPPAADRPDLSDDDLKVYDDALKSFLDRDWTTAYKLLHRVSPDDNGKDFITGYILQHNHMPPPEWNGVIEMSRK